MQEEIYDDDEEFVDYAIRPNKSQIKRDIAAIQQIAEEICSLSDSQINDLNLPENITAAVLEAGKMPHKGARKRQLKFITAQLRKLELDELKEKLDRLNSQSAHAVREHHLAEKWRDLLLSENGANQLTCLLNEHPEADAQHVRQLQRNALKESTHQKPPKSARLLYQYLKQLISNHDHDN